MSKSHLINDLIWAINSPPLMVVSPSESNWYSDAFYVDLYNQSTDWFSKIESNSSTLEEEVSASKDKRLGNYFETLWACWIEASERFELIEHNLQIFENGRTIGELDFIVHDKKLNKVLHWELAVKFYLGIGDTRLHENWHGPARKDRLDLKIDHLLNHQTKLCELEVTKRILEKKEITVDGSAVILKGCLFYPSNNINAPSPSHVNTAHNKSRWIKLSEMQSHYCSGETFYPLIGEGWMASLGAEKLESALTFTGVLDGLKQARFRLPMLLSVVRSGFETERVFVVQNDWDKL